MVEYFRVATCVRAVNLEARLGTDLTRPLPAKTARAFALNAAFRKAIAESEYMQTYFKFRPGTDDDAITINGVLIKPDIVFLSDTGSDNRVGVIIPAPRFNFSKPLHAFPHVVRSLKILSVAFGIGASALWVCRETFDVRLDHLEPGEYEKEVETLLAQTSSHKLPDPPWAFTHAYDMDTGNIVYRQPTWPCGSCKVKEECLRLYQQPEA
jgi:hypothetical protein